METISYLGGCHPGKWMVLYADGSSNDNIDEDFLIKEYSEDYVNMLKNMGTGKFVQIPQGANKESHLYKYPDLIKSDAPKLKYTQEGKIDTCVSKAFALVLHYAGYTEIASNINGKFFSKKEVYVCSEPNYTAILDYATPRLPKWLQLCRKQIDKIRWDTDIN